MKGLFTSLLLAGATCSIAGPPNIAFIVGDDSWYGDFGCYGSKTNETPHIDALASRGLRFTDHHSVGTMCSPTSASILTGIYPQRFGPDFNGALSVRDDRYAATKKRLPGFLPKINAEPFLPQKKSSINLIRSQQN